MIRRGRIGLLVSLAAYTLATAADVTPVPVDVDAARINLTRFALLFEAPEDFRDPDEAISAAFTPMSGSSINRGLREGVLWLRLDLHANFPARYFLDLNNPRLRHIDVFREVGDSLIPVASTGTAVPVTNRPMHSRNLIVPLDIEGTQRYYVHIANRGALRCSVLLWKPEAFLTAQTWEHMAFGVFYGLLLAMMLYHLCLYVTLREPLYMHFVLLVVVYGLFHASLNGFAQQFFWPNATWWADRSILFFNGLAMFFAFAFSNHFLELDRRLPGWFALFAALMLLSLFVSAATFLPSLHANLLAHVLGIVGPIALFGAAFYLWRKGVNAAPLFLLGWTAALAGTTAFATMGFGLLPENLVTANGIHVGFTAALILFSFALAQRVKFIEDAHRQRLVSLNGHLQRQLADCTTEIDERSRRLRALATQLTKAEQAARRKLAQGLHDHLQQLLVAVQYRLLQLDRTALAPAERVKVEEAEAMLRESIAASRELAMEISPPALHRAGLAAALDWLGRRMESRHDLDVNIAVDAALPALPEDQCALVFEITRELLFNIVKHAGTRTAQVKVSHEPAGWLRVAVEDDGMGFDPEMLTKTQDGLGFGLAEIRGRLACLGGSIHVSSSRGHGTRVEVQTPLLVSD